MLTLFSLCRFQPGHGAVSPDPPLILALTVNNVMAGYNISFGVPSLSRTQGWAFSGVFLEEVREIKINCGVISPDSMMKNEKKKREECVHPPRAPGCAGLVLAIELRAYRKPSEPNGFHLIFNLNPLQTIGLPLHIKLP